VKDRHEKNKITIVRVLGWIVGAIVVFIAFFGDVLFNETSVFSHILSESETGIEAAFNFIMDQVPRLIRAAVYVVLITIIFKFVRKIVEKLVLKSKRGKTTSKLIDSFIRYLSAIVIIVVILLVFGVDPVALFASIGVLGLIIGLGAQSLISDIISGLFIVFEGEYDVGDYIIIDGFRGKVESIGIRTTQFVDSGGNIKIINNSEIKSVVNLSYDDSLLTVDVIIKQHAFQKAEKVIKDNINNIRKNLPQFSDGPEYVGISDFTKEGVQLKFIGKVREDERFQSERDLRREIKLLFDAHDIDFALPKIYIEDSVKK